MPLPTVPSVFSFYQDIMPEHKPSIRCVDKLKPRSRLVAQLQGGAVVRMQEKRASGLNCSCASERRPWRPCLLGASPAADHPGLVDVMNVTKEDTFALVKCGEKSTLAKGFDIHHRSVTLDLSPEKPPVEPAAVGPSEGRASRMGRDAPPPDVLVIEVDSLSRAAARRHLPQLTRLLATHRKVQDEFADVELSLLGVAGSNSIPNQAALLAGCVTVYDGDVRVPPQPDHRVAAETISGWRMWCPRGNRTNAANPSVAPWLFSIAKQLGYVTFVGEEICAAGEPVPRGCPLPVLACPRGGQTQRQSWHTSHPL